MKKGYFLMTLLLLIVFLLSGCAEKTKDPKGQANGATLADDAVIEIVGAGLNFTLTAQEMLAREKETFTCTNVSSSGEVVTETVTGFSLNELLAEKGVAIADVSLLNFISSDGYVIAAPADLFVATPVYIIYKRFDNEAMEYPASCIPDQRAMYWAKELVKIEVATDGAGLTYEKNEVKKLTIFREAVHELEPVELNDEGYTVKGYSLDHYFEKFALAAPEKPIILRARDNFEKIETPGIFLTAYVTLEAKPGKESELPFYYSENFQAGMCVKYLDLVISGEDAVYFGSETSLADLFERAAIKKVANYRFVAADGWAAEIPAGAIPFGKILTGGKEDCIQASFTGYDDAALPVSGNIKNLLAIEAVD